ncbi:MAG: RNA methyltransferase [Planctomycetaceae bacterium]
MLELRNPHSILAALKQRPSAVRSIRISAQHPSDVWAEVAEVAKRCGVPVSAGRTEGPGVGRQRRGTERTGAGSANVEPPSPIPLSNLLQRRNGEHSHGIWLALDQIQDPQNVGALFRLAGFFNVRGILMTRDRSASVNATVCDVSAGGAEYVPFSVVSNLAQAMKKAQEHDIWLLGTSEHAASSIRQVSRDRNWMLVLGNEGDGIRRLTRENCDVLCSLPPSGPIGSLNVATAAAACLAILTGDPAPGD